MDLRIETYKQVVEDLYDGLYFVDKKRVITYWNKAAERISGYRAEEVVGKSCADSILTHVDCDGTNLCHGRCPLACTMNDETPREASVYLHHKNGHRVPVSVRINVLKDEEGTVIGGIELFNDISNHAGNELRIRELEKLALLDSLTQLANRNYIERELKTCFQDVKRNNIPFGLLFIDIDRFKKFNDTYGHDIGDQVLKLVAKTFTSSARPFDLYGRWGGEEFIGIIRDITEENLAVLGNRMRILIENSYMAHAGQELRVTISIGATIVKPTDTVKALITRADKLLYRSKKNGRNQLTIG